MCISTFFTCSSIFKFSSVVRRRRNGCVFIWKRYNIVAFSPHVHTETMNTIMKMHIFEYAIQSLSIWKRHDLKTCTCTGQASDNIKETLVYLGLSFIAGTLTLFGLDFGQDWGGGHFGPLLPILATSSQMMMKLGKKILWVEIFTNWQKSLMTSSSCWFYDVIKMRQLKNRQFSRVFAEYL